MSNSCCGIIVFVLEQPGASLIRSCVRDLESIGGRENPWLFWSAILLLEDGRLFILFLRFLVLFCFRLPFLLKLLTSVFPRPRTSSSMSGCWPFSLVVEVSFRFIFGRKNGCRLVLLSVTFGLTFLRKSWTSWNDTLYSFILAMTVQYKDKTYLHGKNLCWNVKTSSSAALESRQSCLRSYLIDTAWYWPPICQISLFVL